MTLCKYVKEQFELYQNMLVGTRVMMCTIWNGGESGHPSLGEKFLLLRANVYKLTGSDIPHPFLTCSLFLCCDICVKNLYTLKNNCFKVGKHWSVCSCQPILSVLPPD